MSLKSRAVAIDFSLTRLVLGTISNGHCKRSINNSRNRDVDVGGRINVGVGVGVRREKTHGSKIYSTPEKNQIRGEISAQIVSPFSGSDKSKTMREKKSKL